MIDILLLAKIALTKCSIWLKHPSLN